MKQLKIIHFLVALLLTSAVAHAWDPVNAVFPAVNTTFNGNGSQAGGVVQTYNIPLTNFPETIYFYVRGADGGNADAGPNINKDQFQGKGGGGAIATATFSVSSTAANALRPGGEIRIIVGNKGAHMQGGSNGTRVAAGGGGGSGVTYKGPEANADWIPLIIAGGGGGGMTSSNFGGVIRANGGNGQIGTSGSSSGGIGGANGEEGESILNRGEGGAGWLGNAFYGAGKGNPSGGSGGLSRHSDRNSSGGFGCGGGGGAGGEKVGTVTTVTTVGGGGGGGYSGGGGGSTSQAGGGGGSIINDLALVDSTKTLTGRSGSQLNGTINIQPSSTTVPDANAKPVITLVGDNPQNVAFSLTDAYTDPGYSAQDYYGNTIAVQVISNNVNLAVSGPYQAVYEATDQFGQTTQKTRTVNVLAGSNRPTFNLLPNLYVTSAGEQSHSVISDFNAGWIDGGVSEQLVRYEITENSNSALFEVSPGVSNAGTLSFTPKVGTLGTATLTIIAIDNGPDPSVIQSLPQQITVTTVVQPFVFQATVDNDFLNSANWSNVSGEPATPATMAATDTYILAANAALSGAAVLEGQLQVNAGITLTIAGTGVLNQQGILNVAGGAKLTVGATAQLNLNGGSATTFTTATLDNSGTIFLNPLVQNATLDLLNNATFVNQIGARFERRPGSGDSTIDCRGQIINHGEFIESVGTSRDMWERVHFLNSATGVAHIRSEVTRSSPIWTNHGEFTAESVLSGRSAHQPTVINSGTMTLKQGSSRGAFGTLSNSGLLFVQGELPGLRNTGTVTLTGNCNFGGDNDGGGTFENRAGGIFNQGAHNVYLPSIGSSWPTRYINAGTWNSSGEIKIEEFSQLDLTSGSVMNNNGSWSFDLVEANATLDFEVGGTLGGTADIIMPTGILLVLKGGEVDISITNNGKTEVTADSALDEIFEQNGTLQVNSGITLTIAGTGVLNQQGILNVAGGAKLTVGATAQLNLNGGSATTFTAATLDNSGTIFLLQAAELDLLNNATFVNQLGARFERRAGPGSAASNIDCRGQIINHGEFIEGSVFSVKQEWDMVNFLNSATGVAHIRAKVTRSGPTWTNHGEFTADVALANSESINPTVVNSGTMTLKKGSVSHVGFLGTVTNSGTLFVREHLAGLRNTGTVNLTGNCFFGINNDSASGTFENRAGGILNQGAHNVFLSVADFFSPNRYINAGTWNSSGEIKIDALSQLDLSSGSVMTNNGSWSFDLTLADDIMTDPTLTIEVGGTLGGSAEMSLPARTFLILKGGTIASHVTTATDVDITSTTTVSGSLALDDVTVSGAGTLNVVGQLTTVGSAMSTLDCPLTLNRPGGKVMGVAAGTQLKTNGAITYSSGDTCVDGVWDHQQTPLQSPVGSILSGTGTVIGATSIQGNLAPGPESGTGELTIQGDLNLLGGAVTTIEVAGAGAGEFDTLVVTGTATLANALQVDFTTRPNAAPGRYEFLVSGAIAQAYTLATPIALDQLRTLQYSASDPGAFTLASISSPYNTWALASGLTPGENDSYYDDSNNDGVPNITHFALDTHPLGSGSSEGKQRLGTTAFQDGDHFTFTIPVRVGASFAGTPSPESSIDGIIYRIQGSSDLATWLLSVTEVVPAQSAGLPALRDIDGDTHPDWEYRTFTLENDPLIRGFLRIEIEETSAP